MVRQRVLYGSLMLAALMAMMVVDASFSNPDATAHSAACAFLGSGGLTTFGFALIVLAGAAELCRLARQAGHRPAVVWSLVMVVLMMLAPWLASAGGQAALRQAGPALVGLAATERILPWLAVLGVAAIMVWRQQTAGATANFATSLLVIFYIGYLGSFCVRLRCWWPGAGGAWLVLATLVVVKVTDIAAYFTGMAIGKRLLIPKISPKKTWEGFIGGIVGSAIVSGVLVGWLLPRYTGPASLEHLTMMQAVVFGIVMAIVGQAGDLAESLFKRDGGAKDSAKLVPTFGGILDLIDSPLLAVPVAYWLLQWWLVA